MTHVPKMVRNLKCMLKNFISTCTSKESNQHPFNYNGLYTKYEYGSSYFILILWYFCMMHVLKSMYMYTKTKLIKKISQSAKIFFSKINEHQNAKS